MVMRFICTQCHRHYTSRTDKKATICPSCGAALRQETPHLSNAEADRTISLVSPSAAHNGHSDANHLTPESSHATPSDPVAEPDGLATIRSNPSGVTEEKRLEVTPPSSNFGKYRIEHEIARGGMGIVYKVHDPDLRRDVALKVLIAGEGATEESILRFIREARAAARLNHPNIVRIYDIGKEDGKQFFTMDFIDGPTLDDLMRKRRAKKDRAEMIDILRRVALALSDAHAEGIYHRDLKPANIMIDRRHEPILMDFGLAKDATSNTIQSMSGSICGTPAYMSPEQAGGQTHMIDHRTDIYALGVILYQLLTGLLPFEGNSVFDTITKVITEEPPAPRRVAPHAVDADMQTIILTCMEKDPAKRYQTMTALAEDLRRYLDGEPIAARPVLGLVRTWRRIRRKPLALAACIALPVIIMTSIILAMYLSGPTVLDQAVDRMRNPAISEADRASTVRYVASLYDDDKLPEGLREEAQILLRGWIAMPGQEASEEAMQSAVHRHDTLAVQPMLLVAQQKDAIGNFPPFSPERRITALTNLVPLLPDVQPTMMPLIAPGVFEICEDADELPDVRIAALNAAAGIMGEKAGERLMGLGVNPKNPIPVRMAAIHAAAKRLSPNSPLMKNMLMLCGDTDAAIAHAAYQAVQSARSKDSILALYGFGGTAEKAMAGVADVMKMQADRNRQLEALMDDMDGTSRQKKEDPWKVVARKLKSSSVEERRDAAQALGLLGDARAIPDLVSGLQDADSAVRTLCVYAIADLAKGTTFDVAPVRQLLTHADVGARASAARLLGLLADAPSIDELSRLVIDDVDMNVVAAAAEAMVVMHEMTALLPLLRVCRQGDAKRVQAVEQNLRTHNVPESKLCLMAMLQHDDAIVRTAADGTLRVMTGQDFQGDPRKWYAWAGTQDDMREVIAELMRLKPELDHPFRRFAGAVMNPERRPLLRHDAAPLRDARKKRPLRP